ncbi:hypothetical protein, partial [Bacillus pumilus]|uniref:hypothetical protein n=1 Tax=Bacillus pumilus TaxID=1408 RepID=UPI001C92CD63
RPSNPTPFPQHKIHPTLSPYSTKTKAHPTFITTLNPTPNPRSIQRTQTYTNTSPYITLHKFLKLSPLIKTTTFAKQLPHQPTISINPTHAKPSADLKEADQLKIPFRQKLLTLQLNHLK